MKKIFFLFVLLLGIGIKAWAQPDLPNVATMSQGGINILSWYNPYTSGVQSITVERTSDPENEDYVTIGTIREIDRPSQYFTDASPLSGKNYYRVKLLFNSNMEWYSNEVLITVNEATDYRKVIPNADSVEAIIEELGVVTHMPSESYEISKYIYTNPYNGNINIEFSNAFDVSYRVEFFDYKGKKVLEIPRVNDVFVVLDKRNFQQNGYFKFVVYKEDKEFTKGTVAVY